MSLDQKVLALAQAVGLDINALVTSRGNLGVLTTTDKTNLVSAINELKAGLATVDLTALIDDASGVGVIDKTWSTDKIIDALESLKLEILDEAPEAMNTLKEIADYLAANDVDTNDLLSLIGNTVRFDAAQSLDSEQQLQACTNIGVANNELDVLSFYVTAKGIVVPPSGGASSPEATDGNFDFMTATEGSSGGVTGNNFAF